MNILSRTIERVAESTASKCPFSELAIDIDLKRLYSPIVIVVNGYYRLNSTVTENLVEHEQRLTLNTVCKQNE